MIRNHYDNQFPGTQKYLSTSDMTSKINQKHYSQTKIAYATTSCDFGSLLVAMTDIGICAVKLGDRPETLIKTFTSEFKQASIIQDDVTLKPWLEKIIKLTESTKSEQKFPLDVQGTIFQKEVWQALQAIPYGETRTYQDIAKSINKPNATRAIGSACGANPVAIVIPCHRVIRSDGKLGGYRWGIERKRQLIIQEEQKLLAD